MRKALYPRKPRRAEIQTTGFDGRPLTQVELPPNDGITTDTHIPEPGERVTHKEHGEGTVISVGWMAGIGANNKSIEVRFDDGSKWFVCQNDLVEA